MAKIEVMPQHLAELIAAGEVVERPGSVIKELIENSIDAGATSLTVEIKNGGMLYIRVSDNGCGIAPEEAATAFLRHATSKLKNEWGLEAINTLGFRGEALASIAAVSRVEMITREEGSEEGTAVAFEGGELVSDVPVGGPTGTTIIVRDLFFNTPARLKFMKKDSAEAAYCASVALRCALSHPEISMRFIKDGKTEFHTPGDGKAESCIYAVLGKEFSKSLLTVHGEDENVTVDGFITEPSLSKGSRSMQFFFLNGRNIKSQVIQAGLEQAYKNSLFTGKFPGCVLYIKLKASMVDVNVHPTKTEVKFVNEKQIFSGVYYAVLSALESKRQASEIKLPAKFDAGKKESLPDGITYAELSKRAKEKSEPKSEQTLSLHSGQGRDFVRQYVQNGIEELRTVEKLMPQYSILEKDAEKKTSDMPQYFSEKKTEVPAVKTEEIKKPEAQMSEVQAKPEVQNQKVQQSIAKAEIKTDIPEKTKLPDFRYVGEVFNTYALVELEDKLLLIDKHAAHERINFDRLKAQKSEIMSQQLLSPYICKANAEDIALITENGEILEDLGFDVEDFGGGSIIIRALPADMAEEKAETVLSEVCESIRLGQKPGSDGVRDELLHSIACKAAIKAGKKSEYEEIIPLIEAVLSGRVKYCPHGRPVSMEIKRGTIDRNFGRT